MPLAISDGMCVVSHFMRSMCVASRDEPLLVNHCQKYIHTLVNRSIGPLLRTASLVPLGGKAAAMQIFRESKAICDDAVRISVSVRSCVPVRRRARYWTRQHAEPGAMGLPVWDGGRHAMRT